MLPKEPRPLNVNDPRALGISTEDLDRFFEHRKHDRTASQGVRASTQSLKESARDLQLPSVSNLDAAGLERELLQARQRGDLPRIIATLQAKVKLRQLGRAERKKVLIDLLLELLNARKIASIEECLKQYEPVVAGTEDDQSEYFSLCFELLSIVSKIEKKSRWVAFFEYQRKGQSVAHLLARKQAKDEESAQRGDYFETGVDYLKRVVQTIELEFKIKQEGRGSASYLFGYGEGPIGIGRESKHHSGRYSAPIVIDSLTNRRILQLACGESHTVAAVLGLGPHGAKLLDARYDEYLFDVVAWGDNTFGQVSGSRELERYEQPVVLPELSGKRILAVSCARTKSAAVEAGGQVFEWGGSESGCAIRLAHTLPGAEELHHGGGFLVARAGEKVYFWGELVCKNRTVANERTPTLISGELRVKRLSVGHDHVLATDLDDLLYGFGSNEFGQACLAQNVESSRRLARSQVCAQKVDRFWALNQLSIIRSQQAEDQLVGLVKRDPMKIVRNPEDFCVAPGVAPHKVRCFNNQVYCLGSNGRVYLWDNRVSLGFKEEICGKEGFNDLHVGRGFLLLQKPLVEPEKCRVQCLSATPMTYEPIELALEVHDAAGKVVCNVGYPLRLGVMLSKNTANAKYVEEYARDMKKYFDALPQAGEDPVLIGDLNDTGDVVMQDLKVLKSENGNVHFTFLLKHSGEFFLFCSLNEKSVFGELLLRVKENPEGEPAKQSDPEIDYLKLEVEEQAREEAERRREFLAAKKKQQEEEVRRAEEELKAKVHARAEQNAKAFYMEKKLKELREAEAKKQRADMRTGGGFDLDRAKLARQKTEVKDSAPSTSATLSKKELAYIPAPETPTRAERGGLEQQLSQYGGIAYSERPDDESEAPEFQRQDSELLQSKRPGSSGFRIKDFNRSSRPNSRFGEPRDPADAAKGSLVDSQVLYEHSKKLPVRANRTGESFHPKPEAGLDFVSGKELTRKLEAQNRDFFTSSQPREQLGSSQSGKPFKLLNPSSTRTADRGTSQDFGQRKGLQPAAAEDKTAPKRQKGGFSLNKKADPTKLPSLAPVGGSSKQPAHPPNALLGPGMRRKVGK